MLAQVHAFCSSIKFDLKRCSANEYVATAALPHLNLQYRSDVPYKIDIVVEGISVRTLITRLRKRVLTTMTHHC